MTKEEAQIIFKSWQNYMETADRFGKLLMTPPESFLPYPAEVLEEALNIVAKDFFDSGDKEISKTIQTTMAGYLSPYLMETKLTDEEALANMKRMIELMFENSDLKKTLLNNLKESQDRWMGGRKKC